MALGLLPFCAKALLLSFDGLTCFDVTETRALRPARTGDVVGRVGNRSRDGVVVAVFAWVREGAVRGGLICGDLTRTRWFCGVARGEEALVGAEAVVVVLVALAGLEARCFRCATSMAGGGCKGKGLERQGTQGKPNRPHDRRPLCSQRTEGPPSLRSATIPHLTTRHVVNTTPSAPRGQDTTRTFQAQNQHRSCRLNRPSRALRNVMLKESALRRARPPTRDVAARSATGKTVWPG